MPPTASTASISSRVQTPTRSRAFGRVRCLWYTTNAKVSSRAQASSDPGSGSACRMDTFRTFDAVAPEDLRHLRHELVEAVHRHEVLLQDVGAVPARRRLQLRHVVAGLEVPPMDAPLQVEDGIDQELAPPLAERGLRDRPQEVALQRVGLAMGLQPVGRRHRLVGLHPGAGADGPVVGRVEVAVVEQRVRAIADLAPEVGHVVVRLELRETQLDPRVVRERQLRLHDHAQAAVAADRPVEDSAFSVGVASTTSPLIRTTRMARTERMSGPRPM